MKAKDWLAKTVDQKFFYLIRMVLRSGTYRW